MHHVRVDHLVALQHLLRHRHAVPRKVREAVPGGRFRVHAAHRGDGEVHGQRGVLSQQLPDDGVGRVGRVQRHLRDGHEEAAPHGQDEPGRWLHVQVRDISDREVHDARVPHHPMLAVSVV